MSSSESSSSPPRPSRFIEGTEHTHVEMIARAPTNPELFNSILSEMDARSSSATMSTSSATTSPTTSNNSTTPSQPIPGSVPTRRARNASSSSSTSNSSFEVLGGRRGPSFDGGDAEANAHQSSTLRQSLDAVKRVIDNGADKTGMKSSRGTIKGRLRALTGGEKDSKR